MALLIPGGGVVLDTGTSLLVPGSGVTLFVASDTSLSVTSAAFQIDGSDVTLTWTDALSVAVTAASFQIDGQEIALSWVDNWTLPVTAAGVQIDGQDITLSWVDGWSIAVDATSLSGVGQDITLTLSSITTTPSEVFSGGYGVGAADRTLHLRKKRQRDDEQDRLDEQERIELADKLEAQMIAEGILTQQKADLLRLRGLANEYDNDLPNRVRRAVVYAEKVRTQQALELALREMERMQQDDEVALLLAIHLDS